MDPGMRFTVLVVTFKATYVCDCITAKLIFTSTSMRKNDNSLSHLAKPIDPRLSRPNSARCETSRFAAFWVVFEIAGNVHDGISQPVP